MSNETTAVAQRLLNPVRMQRWMFSDLNPWMAPVKAMAESVRADRRPAPPDNPFSRLERTASKQIEEALDQYRDARDELTERVFKAIYESPWLAPSVGVDAKTRASSRRIGDLGAGGAQAAQAERDRGHSSSRGRCWMPGRGSSSMCDTRAIPPTSVRSTCFAR